MAGPFEKIDDVTDSKELWKVVVKVHCKWLVVSSNKKHFEMTLIDKEVNLFTDIFVYFEEERAPFVVMKLFVIMGYDFPVSNAIVQMSLSGTDIHDVVLTLYMAAFDSILTEWLIALVTRKPNQGLRNNMSIFNKIINCTLWDTYASQFIKFNQQRINTLGPTVILLHYTKGKEEGKYPLYVTNSVAKIKNSVDEANSDPTEDWEVVTEQYA
ncbi:uncharacterized protein LOC127130342 [Lathyrus oleraceus]|uniref:uncharacterized protein LOC127130342 n=1 Tax=Pisum sativum TaxID=3888 RepID=UPI0021D1A75E|nr:uncharacterized protein LOC127130342 [Pisum sativum]